MNLLQGYVTSLGPKEYFCEILIEIPRQGEELFSGQGFTDIY